MKNLKYLASKLSEKIDYWQHNLDNYKKLGFETDFERGRLASFQQCLDMVEELISKEE